MQRQHYDVAILTCLATAMAIAVWLLFEPEYISPDSAQLISATINLLSGMGLSTDALYYAEQLSMGPMPVPLTVWPPGFAVVMLPFVAMGFDGITAAFLASAAGFISTVPLTYLVAREAGACRGFAALAATAMLLFEQTAAVLLLAMSDTVYIALTLASAWTLLKAAKHSSPNGLLLLAGILAAGAFCMRYSGLTWLAAAGMFVLISFRSNRVPALITRALSFGLVPATAVVTLLGRNLMLTGSLTGGPAVPENPAIYMALRANYLAVAGIFGADHKPWDIVFALAVVALLFFCIRTALSAKPRSLAPVSEDFPASSLPLLALLYCAFTFTLIFSLSFLLYTDAAQPRYYAPVIPFVAAALACLFSWHRPSSSAARQRPATIAACAFLAISLFVAGQYSVAVRQLQHTSSLHRTEQHQDMVTTSVRTMPLTGYLQQHVTREHPLLMADGQSTTALLGIPTISQPEPRYSRTMWDDAATQKLMAGHSACLLLIHHQSLRVPGNENRTFLTALSSGKVPKWLLPLAVTNEFALYQRLNCS